ncbi:MAG: flagellar hook-length control protein FliK [Candidatus Eremiobacteraeota bacterium]|nr:flagellar hook-length control protein FliK [Candidatus Eremiobacteraeota bacterium]
MDNNTLASLVGMRNSRQATPSRGRGQKRDATEDEGRLFSRFFEEETDKSKKKKKGKTEKALIEGKKEKSEDSNKLVTQKKAEVNAKTDELQRNLQKSVRSRLTKMNPTLNYLYNLMYKNPDALSLAEKNSLGLEKNPELNAGFNELKKLLMDRGLKVSNLTFNQMAKLTRCETRSQITAFLDKLADEKQKGFNREKDQSIQVEKGKEKVATKQGIQRGDSLDKQLNTMTKLTHVMKDDQTAEAEKSTRQLKREEVINQIIDHLEVKNLGKKTELTMKLNPEYLGNLKMKITYEEGRMVTRFETTSRDVRKLLKDGMRELLKEFGRKGLKVDRTDVKLVESID